jgi:hypothetical protein
MTIRTTDPSNSARLASHLASLERVREFHLAPADRGIHRRRSRIASSSEHSGMRTR